MNSFIKQTPAEKQANILLMTNTCIGGFNSIYRRKTEKINKTWKINWASHSNSLEPAPECLQNIPLKIQMHNNLIFSLSRSEGWALTQNRCQCLLTV